ncbi:unnamed protein product [Vitrella brassicaformis CCMP3155]|uniref:t-SNARE coiled-coil homology domain-containing protein n=1 Tax=Vitrella brassicaformis (strain CCMP3155) TaxID=1169540 RepID=A0A0G4FCN9_VITBC|nr:unnamed protein product [Vitrella brassicaformis CCMP3155]|mmetsp:Transcript_12843/g.30635  ORF Transcript_12843/g.30635 Transcript_12843/m.30635 type:complete len:241 (-) Transcript_12843:28-750(-)|eukprot:CEM11002.1 unnamed protein product [Vitrella brassicaformis CCMP3155]
MAEGQSRELLKLLDELRDAIESVSQADKSQRRSRIQDCDFIAQQVRTAREAYQLEMRSLAPEDARQHKANLDERMRDFKMLLNQLEWKKNELDREQLTGGAVDVGEEVIDVDQMNAQQIIDTGDRVQDKTQQSLDRTKRMIGDAEQVGQQVVQRLDQQTDQMARIHDQMHDIENNLTRAKATMRTIARNAVSDRCIQMLCGLICLTIVIMIVLAALGKDGGQLNVPDQIRGAGQSEERGA